MGGTLVCRTVPLREQNPWALGFCRCGSSFEGVHAQLPGKVMNTNIGLLLWLWIMLAPVAGVWLLSRGNRSGRTR